MRPSFLSLFIVLCCGAFAQVPGRYQKAVFDSVVLHNEIQYGEADFYDANSNHDLAPLYLDFYEPFGDTLSARPLVITLFGGAFLGGNKEWDDMIAWCDSLSRYGYACASIQYRLLFNPLNQQSIIRASYRAVQDTRAAIRFLIEEASTYGIDPNRIFLVGNSAGSITALLTAFITDDGERPLATYGFGSSSDADDLGCLDCSGNNLSHEVKLAGIISLWGGVWDINCIEADEKIPSLLIHGTGDGTVPYDTGHAFGLGITPFVYGSVPIAQQMAALGIQREFYPFDTLGHAFYMDDEGFTFPNQYWDTVFTLGHNFLYKVVSGTFTNIEEGVGKADLSIYPNPADEYISLKIPGGNYALMEVCLTSALGMKIQSWRLPLAEPMLDVSGVSPGIYFLHVRNGGEMFVKKVIVF